MEGDVMGEKEKRAANIRLTIEILTDGTVNVVHPNGECLEELPLGQMPERLSGAKIKNVEVSPLSTYLEVNSGYIFVNGRWYYYTP
jgi:hypothetical protein